MNKYSCTNAVNHEEFVKQTQKLYPIHIAFLEGKLHKL